MSNKPHPWENLERIPLDKCKKGRVYRIHSRNLKVGVFNGKDGFIGIREKFGDRYLFTEYHWDQGEPYGTVAGIKDTIGRDVPEDIVDSKNKELFKILEECEELVGDTYFKNA